MFPSSKTPSTAAGAFQKAAPSDATGSSKSEIMAKSDGLEGLSLRPAMRQMVQGKLKVLQPSETLCNEVSYQLLLIQHAEEKQLFKARAGCSGHVPEGRHLDERIVEPAEGKLLALANGAGGSCLEGVSQALAFIKYSARISHEEIYNMSVDDTRPAMWISEGTDTGIPIQRPRDANFQAFMAPSSETTSAKDVLMPFLDKTYNGTILGITGMPGAPITFINYVGRQLDSGPLKPCPEVKD